MEIFGSFFGFGSSLVSIGTNYLDMAKAPEVYKICFRSTKHTYLSEFFRFFLKVTPSKVFFDFFFEKSKSAKFRYFQKSGFCYLQHAWP